MDVRGKKLSVNSSTLVDLKAELYRKQVEFKQTKLSSAPISKLKTKKKEITEDIKSASEPTNKQETTLEYEDVERSRRALEAKAKLYERLSNSQNVPDETEELYLVNFQKKAHDNAKLSKISPVLENTNINKEEENSNPEEDWVDYVDSLGRSRKCLRKDLPTMIEMDIYLAKRASIKPDLMSEDMERDLERQNWENEEAKKEPVGPVHYQNVQYEEVRNHGVGYFAFAKDEKIREEQQKLLNNLRQQTLDQRNAREKIKESRKRALEARLEKIKLRKKIKSNKELKEDSDELSNDDEKYRDVSVQPVVPETTKAVKKTAVRPWDIGKIGAQGEEKKPKKFSEESWIEKQRQLRIQEFAPPDIYAKSTKWKNNKQNRPNFPINKSEIFTQNGSSSMSNANVYTDSGSDPVPFCSSTNLDDIPLPPS